MQLDAFSVRISPCRYWPAVQRLVLLGWTEDARDLLYVHSDLQDAEERLLQQNKVSIMMLLVLQAACHQGTNKCVSCNSLAAEGNAAWHQLMTPKKESDGCCSTDNMLCL